MKGLVVIAKQRTGTNFLRSLLAQCSNGKNCGEVFHTQTLNANGNFFAWLERAGLSYPAIRSDAEVTGLLTRYFDDLERDFAVPIIDIKYNSLWAVSPTWMTAAEPPLILRLLARRGWRFVHLVRTRRLDQAMSLVIAQETGVYITFEEVAADGRFTVDLDRLAALIAQYGREQALVAGYIANLRRAVEVTYEELNDAPDTELRPLIRRLLQGSDIVFERFAPARTRKIVKDWRDHVANAAEVEARFNPDGTERPRPDAAP